MFNLIQENNNYYIQSKANLSKYCCGKFTTPSLRELRECIGNKACDEELLVEHIVIFYVESIHKPGATIQVASQIFVNIPNITYTATQECCVCTNHTLTKTPCNHQLCHRCWFKLKLNSERDIPCPMCRQDIGYIDMEN